MKFGKINGLNVKNLYVSDKADLDCETFIDHFGLGGNPLRERLDNLSERISALEKKG